YCHMKSIFLFLMLMGAMSGSPDQNSANAKAKKPAEKPAQESKQAKAPLPERLLSAKTMCIKVRSAPDADVAEARKELTAWGRFQVMEDCAQAEITLWIQARVVPEAEICGAVIQITANSDGAILWTSNTKCKKSTKGLVGLLVRKLRKEMTPVPAATKSKKSPGSPPSAH
ncbi:MAG: hypothetical protein ACHP79_09330, partial [Terriglobales bacterium]